MVHSECYALTVTVIARLIQSVAFHVSYVVHRYRHVLCLAVSLRLQDALVVKRSVGSGVVYYVEALQPQRKGELTFHTVLVNVFLRLGVHPQVYRTLC